MARGLTQKQKTFCLKYFELRNATEAALAAGYSSRNARRIGSENLTKLDIKQRIDELNQKVEDDLVMNVLERKQRLSEIARARLTDYVTCGPDRDLISVGPESPNTAALQEITSRTEYDKDGAGAAVITKLKLHNPITAIDLLNKMGGDYPPSKVEVDPGKTLGPMLTNLLSKLRGYGNKDEG